MSEELNLLPLPRRIANDRRRAWRRWFAWGSVWCATLAAAQAIALSSRDGVDLAPVEREIGLLEAERERLDAEIVALEQGIERESRSLAATRAVVDHPDWSVLLGHLVAARSEGLAFRRWALARGMNGSLVLRIEGSVPSHGGLTDFALRLEDLRVFRRVTIVTAQAAAVVREDGPTRAVTFAIDAELLPAAPSGVVAGAGGGS